MKRKEENHIKLFFVICVLEMLAANFAHPITPTIIKNLNLHDYMFGLAFAGMSFTNFLFSPFWGKVSSYISSRKILCICCFGYSIGQLMFCFSSTEPTIMVARCFSGIFAGGISVAMYVFILENSTPKSRGINLTILAIVQAVSAAFGYMIGGFLGIVTIRGTFFAQSFTLALSGVLFFFLFKENKNKIFEEFHVVEALKDANPIAAFWQCRFFMTKTFAMLFLVVLFANLGTNAFDQCFNYYIKDQFGFSSAYNGMLKAIVGVITLAANWSICLWMIRKGTVRKSSAIVLFFCAFSVAGIIVIQNLVPFVLVCLIFFMFNAIYAPLLQESVAKEALAGNRDMVMAFYNAMKSLGMIGGALIAGLIYANNPKMPFVFAGIAFGAAAMLLAVSSRHTAKIKQ